MEATAELTREVLLKGARAALDEHVIVQRPDAVAVVGEGSKVLDGTDPKNSHVVLNRVAWIEALEQKTKPTAKSATAKE